MAATFNELDVLIIKMVNELAHGKWEYRPEDLDSRLLAKWYLEYKERVGEAAAAVTEGAENGSVKTKDVRKPEKG